MRFFKTLGLLLFLSLVAISCTRKKGETSKIRFSIPTTFNSSKASGKVGAQSIPSDYILSHIAVNISGSSIPGGVSLYSWDACDRNDCDKSPPSEISMEVPSGSALIQYLGVYENMESDDGGLLITYGDVEQALSSGENIVEINVDVYGNPLGEKEVKIAGQYVTSIDSNGRPRGPTGKVRIGIKSPKGGPDMVLMYKEIFNGWFEFFSLESIPFVFRMDGSGEELKGLQVNALNSKLSDRVMKLSLPKSYLERYCGDNDCGSEDLEPIDFYLGYYGPSISNDLKVCYPDSPESQISDSQGNKLWADSAKGTPVGWDPSGSGGSNKLKRIGGGLPDSSSACVTRYEFQNKVSFNLGLINQGFHQVGPFEGPFRRGEQKFIPTLSDQCDRENSTAAGCYDSINGKGYIRASLVPQAGLSGVTLFTKVGPQCHGDCFEDLRDQDDGYECQTLADKAGSSGTYKGFKKQADITSGNIDYSFPIVLAEGDQVLGVLCPYKGSSNRTYYSSGVGIYELANYGYSSGFSDPMSLGNLYFWLDPQDNSTIFSDDSCTEGGVAVGAEVGCWKDKGGSNLGFYNTTQMNRPILSSNLGGTSLAFDGSGDYLTESDSGGFTGPITMFLVIQHVDVSEPQHYFEMYYNTANPYDYWGVSFDGNFLAYWMGDQLTSSYSNGTSNVNPTNGLNVITYLLRSPSSSQMEIKINGISATVNPTSSEASQIYLNPSISMKLGTNASSYLFRGYMGDVILYNRDLDSWEEDEVTCYLKNKWDITDGPSCP